MGGHADLRGRGRDPAGSSCGFEAELGDAKAAPPQEEGAGGEEEEQQARAGP